MRKEEWGFREGIKANFSQLHSQLEASLGYRRHPSPTSDNNYNFKASMDYLGPYLKTKPKCHRTVEKRVCIPKHPSKSQAWC